ncbi:TetR/AcrR family transcriptional regulator [Pseudonocardia dioxanivorans]|uniref:TetR/AcrR family transcriptional regulator n=1 Tax=Pseudonocardia dioxanivorans TaxID=240495 RepID=UPI000CD30668|nr:TetR/AcrR family transcriptional regulator [Pseudonocardia dioxanivorans]
MAEVSDRPLRADARRNREKVLRAAQEAFAEHGMGVPLDEIAGRAGVGPGTVYRHFPTKEALFEAVVAARMQDLITAARAGAHAADPGEAFFGFLALLADEAGVKRDLSDALVAPPAVATSLRTDLRAALEVLLTRAQQAGAVRDGIRVDDLFALLKGLMAALVETADDARDRLIAVVVDGLRAPR